MIQMEDKIVVSLVLEILGRPAEHVSEALNTLVLRLGAEKGVKITNKTLHEPSPVKDSKTLFTSFAEVDLEIDSLESYVSVIFTYMPSHIEVIFPEKITISNSHLNEIGNAITQRLHHYDAITKNVIVERNALMEKLKEVSPELFKKEQNPKKNKPKKKSTKKKK